MHPILFKIGSFEVHTFGLVMIVAFLVGLWIARVRAPKFGIDPGHLSDMAFYALIAGVLGARITYLLLDPPADWHEILTLKFAGLTSFGGLVGAALVIIFWSRKHKISVRAMLDALGPALLVGQAIGRVGCLMNGCCYGGVCPDNFPFGVRTPENALLHYPAQVYDSLMCLALAGILIGLERRFSFRLGQVASLAIGFWGLSRFVDEFWRAGTVAQVQSGLASSTYWDGLPVTQAQVAALAMMVLAAIMFFVYARRPVAAEPLPA